MIAPSARATPVGICRQAGSLQSGRPCGRWDCVAFSSTGSAPNVDDVVPVLRSPAPLLPGMSRLRGSRRAGYGVSLLRERLLGENTVRLEASGQAVEALTERSLFRNAAGGPEATQQRPMPFAVCFRLSAAGITSAERSDRRSVRQTMAK